MKKLGAVIAALLFTAFIPLAQAGSASTGASNPEPLPLGQTMNAKKQVNPQPLPPPAGGQLTQGGALIEGFTTVSDRNIDRVNAIGKQQGVSRGSICTSQPARKH